MSRTIRLSLALLFALMMVIATASGALAFDPPADNPSGNDDASTLCAFEFPANPGFVGQGPAGFNGAGPWNASIANPAGVGPIPFGGTPDVPDCD